MVGSLMLAQVFTWVAHLCPQKSQPLLIQLNHSRYKMTCTLGVYHNFPGIITDYVDYILDGITHQWINHKFKLNVNLLTA